jgi:hypothetical protein
MTDRRTFTISKRADQYGFSFIILNSYIFRSHGLQNFSLETAALFLNHTGNYKSHHKPLLLFEKLKFFQQSC